MSQKTSRVLEDVLRDILVTSLETSWCPERMMWQIFQQLFQTFWRFVFCLNRRYYRRLVVLEGVNWDICALGRMSFSKHVAYSMMRIFWQQYSYRLYTALLKNVWPHQQKKDMKLLILFIDSVMLKQTLFSNKLNNFLFIWTKSNNSLQIFFVSLDNEQQ